MQHIGRVRQTTGARQSKRKRSSPPATTPRMATTFSDVDIWAGIVLRGMQFQPLARQLFSNRHSTIRGQNRFEEAVLGQQRTVLGQRLTVGKLAEALSLDDAEHRPVWRHLYSS